MIAMLALIAAIVAFVYLILDALLEQLSTLIGSLPEIAGVIGEFLRGLGLPENVEAALAVGDGLPGAVPDLLGGLFGIVASGVGGLVALVIAWAAIPFFIFYALSDSPRLLNGLRAAVPGSFRASVFAILKILGDVFGAWARGTAIIAGIVFVPFLIGFYLFGIFIDPDIGKYALLFAATLALSELIPVIGPIIAIIPILAITAVIAGLPGVVAVGILFIVIEQIDGAVVQPKVQGQVLDLHPAIILPALVVGSALAGLMGAILALPLTAAARQTIAYLLRITSGEPEPRPRQPTRPIHASRRPRPRLAARDLEGDGCGPLQGLSFLHPETGDGRGLLHPRRQLAFVEVVSGFEVHAARVLAHADRGNGGTGVRGVPRPNVSLTWPAKPPQEKHQPSPTPYHAMPHFTERCRPGSVLAARASTRSAMER